ncbi:YraN family protein [Holophaga foetida]|uniref:YraN family protein n=1 Tax=Holophaga foetida TaxID=35839 RepID=UPI00130E80C7|nr:YraN family protein [Holophaga foetida]
MNGQSKNRRATLARRYGRLAERATLWLLWLRGWDLVASNLKLGKSELDLLVTRGEELRLLEVKARRQGAWVAADTALSYPQRLRLQGGLRNYLDRVPWPGAISFQRVSWTGWRWRFHPCERWDALRIKPMT